MVLAHRGDSFHAPENTIEAARAARDEGADAWELDVQVTRDGVAIVLHDESLVRTTDVARRFARDPRGERGFLISDFDLDEVRTLDAGSWFLGDESRGRTAAFFGTRDGLEPARRAWFASGNVRVPTLVEALELTRDLDWVVNVELKAFPSDPPALLSSVLDDILATGTADRVLLSSFDHRLIARHPCLVSSGRAELEAIPRGILVWTPLHRPLEYLTSTVGADAYHVSAEALGAASLSYRLQPAPHSLRVADVAELVERRIPVLVYTVNDCRPNGLADHLAAIGVSAFFTDDPRGMRRRFSSTAD